MATNPEGKCEHCDTHIGAVGYHESAACKDVLKRQRDQAQAWFRQAQEATEKQFKLTEEWKRRYLAAKAEGERMVFQLQERFAHVLNKK